MYIFHLLSLLTSCYWHIWHFVIFYRLSWWPKLTPFLQRVLRCEFSGNLYASTTSLWKSEQTSAVSGIQDWFFLIEIGSSSNCNVIMSRHLLNKESSCFYNFLLAPHDFQRRFAGTWPLKPLPRTSRGHRCSYFLLFSFQGWKCLRFFYKLCNENFQFTEISNVFGGEEFWTC